MSDHMQYYSTSECRRVVHENENDDKVDNSTAKTQDELLIDCVKSYPHLYDHANKDFKDSNMRISSWDAISRVMDKSVAVCQTDWKRLRENFSKEKRRREEESKSHNGATHRLNFPYYDYMESFLGMHVKRRRTRKSYPVPEKRCKLASNTYSMPPALETSDFTSTSASPSPRVDSENILHSPEEFRSLSSIGKAECIFDASESASSPTRSTTPFRADLFSAAVNKTPTGQKDSFEESLTNILRSLQQHLTTRAQSYQVRPISAFAAFVDEQMATLTDTERKYKMKQIVQILFEKF